MKDLNQIGFYTLSNTRVENVSETSQMKRCELIITEYCNFKCPYCRGLNSSIYGDRRFKELSLLEIKKIIDLWCTNEPLENIRFSGGEPTLHRDIVSIVEYAKSKGIKRIALSTNGSNDRELYSKLIRKGVDDFSISLDACCSNDGDKMAGNIKDSWFKVIDNIKYIASKTYVTLGVVFTPDNIGKVIETIILGDSLGVSDIRIISSAQYNEPITELENVPLQIRNKYPILNYRINHFLGGRNVRGIKKDDSNKCALVIDDSIIAGDYHFPCVIYMREKGNPIGKVSENIRKERIEWFKNHDSKKDLICARNCLDVCIDYNNKYMAINPSHRGYSEIKETLEPIFKKELISG